MNKLGKNTKKICIEIAIAVLTILGVLTLSAFAAEINGMKWDDSNGNAIRDAGELGVQGVTICHYGIANGPAYPGDCTTTTDANGNYSLLNLINDTYVIYEVTPPGKAQTFPVGCPIAVNCSGGPGFYEVTVTGTDVVNGEDFGNADASEIQGTKFDDPNGNGIQDSGELGVPNIAILLRRIVSPGNELFWGFRTTDANGNYNFSDLPAGFYKLEESGTFGVSQTFPANGAPNYVTLGVGEVKTGVNFGNQQVPPGTITGIKFNDSNGNGVQDGIEGGISGINFTLYPSGITVTTDINGIYTFADVPIGSYTLFENPISGYASTTPTYVNVQVTSGQTSTVNFGNRKLTPPPSDVFIPQQTGTLGGIPTLRPSIQTLTIQKNLSGIDVATVNLTLIWSSKTISAFMTNNGGLWTATFTGPFPSGSAEMIFNVDVNPPGSGPEDFQEIGDVVFIDPSGQIRNSCNNQPIEGAVVTLYMEFPLGSGNGNFIIAPNGSMPPNMIPDINPETTLADGLYSWLVPPGTYKVGATKTGFNPIITGPVTVVNQPVTGLDIILPPTGGCPLAQLGSISGIKFEDINANHNPDSGEPGLANWTIKLTNDTGITTTQLTASDGSYNFTNLTDGNYTVSEVLQSGWTQTAPTTGSYVIKIIGGDVVTGKDFGNFHEGKITGGGSIPAGNKDATFGIVGQYLPCKGVCVTNGNVLYQDQLANLNIKSIQISSVATTSKTIGVITGLARVNGEGSYPFTIRVEDNGEPGKGVDKFEISIPSIPYSNGGILSEGNIKIQN